MYNFLFSLLILTTVSCYSCGHHRGEQDIELNSDIINFLSEVKSIRERALSDSSLSDIEELKFDTDNLKLENIVEDEIQLFNTPLESPLRFASPRIYNNYVHYKKKGSR